MGQNTSINLSSYQETANDISQISNEQCINLCTDSANINVSITNSDVGNLTIKEGCFINSPSCVLKASLDSTLINKLSSTQDASITSGLFAFLDDLAEIGSNKQISENSYQKTYNKVTQQLNSLCMTHNDTSGNIVVNINNAKVQNYLNDKTAEATKSSCIIDNMAKNYIENDLTNTQKASISTGTIGLGMLLLLAIVAIIVMTHRKKHKKLETENSSQAEAEESEALAVSDKTLGNDDEDDKLIAGIINGK